MEAVASAAAQAVGSAAAARAVVEPEAAVMAVGGTAEEARAAAG